MADYKFTQTGAEIQEILNKHLYRHTIQINVIAGSSVQITNMYTFHVLNTSNRNNYTINEFSSLGPIEVLLPPDSGSATAMPLFCDDNPFTNLLNETVIHGCRNGDGTIPSLTLHVVSIEYQRVEQIF